MTNVQLYLAIGIPILVNAAMFGLLVMYINARLDAINQRFEARFDAIDQRFDAINQRFNDMRVMWSAELHRVGEVLDARLKHIEEERR